MDWERIQANWPHYRVIAQAYWPRIADDEFDLIAGRREVLIGQIQEAYRMSLEMAQMQVESWQRRQRDPEAASR